MAVWCRVRATGKFMENFLICNGYFGFEMGRKPRVENLRDTGRIMKSQDREKQLETSLLITWMLFHRVTRMHSTHRFTGRCCRSCSWFSMRVFTVATELNHWNPLCSVSYLINEHHPAVSQSMHRFTVDLNWNESKYRRKTCEKLFSQHTIVFFSTQRLKCDFCKRIFS